MSGNRDSSKKQKAMLSKYKRCPFALVKVLPKTMQKRINHKSQIAFRSTNCDILLLNRNRLVIKLPGSLQNVYYQGTAVFLSLHQTNGAININFLMRQNLFNM